LGTRLWERRRTDADFGALRLGLGSRPSTVVYSLSRNGGVEDAMMRSAKRLAEDSRVLTEVPINISLFESVGEGNGAGAVQHAVGVVGQSAADVRTYVSALLVHLAALHAPTDMRLFVLGLQSSRDAWRWMGRLPHCSGERSEDVLCFEDQVDRDGEKDHGKVSRFLRGLRSALEDRQTRLRDEGKGAATDWPSMLLVIDLLSALPAESALADLEGDPGISQILNRGAALGAAVLFLAPDMGRVPSGCRAIIELTSTNNSDGQPENGVGFRYAEVGVNSPRYAGKADLIPNAQALGQFGQYLKTLRMRESYGADLPRSVLMQDMLGFRTAEELRQRMLANWQRSQRPDQAEWLQVALGALSGGDIRRLKLSADADGVHGLIAGSTGSGKSELLMTMILGLAYNYDPSIVNFVLVDFKGGAAFEPFRNLPHCVDIVTNLKGNAVERMFAAIMAEIHRREAINVTTGA
jgi:DNA segregation ATPase FtsK/SpoIIIE-like protein